MNLFRLLLLFCCLALSIVSTAQDPVTAKLDSLFSHIEQNNQGMGSLSLFKAGKPYYSKAIGYTDLAAEKKASTATRYKIRSISKTFTATMILQLVEEEQLSLDHRLNEFYPEVKNAELITIQHLLQHRTGIQDYLLSIEASDLITPQSKEELLARIITGPSVFAPDSKYEYSNSNYALLGWILEDITGKSYAELLAERITTPLGLSSTVTGNTDLADPLASSSYHMRAEWEPAGEWDMSWAFGAGEISSTPTEVNAFLNALLAGELVSPEIVTQMKDLNEGYGLGMIAVPFGISMGYGHNGRIENFNSSAYHFEDFDLSICYISNGDVMATNDILIAVLSIANGLPYEFPEFIEMVPIDVPLEELKTYEGNYVSASFPMDIKVFLSDETLMAQATGQGPFPLTGVGDGEFVFKAAGINMKLDASTRDLTLKQAGMTTVFSKE